MDGIRVRALRTGYYDHARRRGDDTMGEGQGDVFTLVDREISIVDVKTQAVIGHKILSAEEQFSEKWMVRVDEQVPEKTSGAQAALTQVNEELLSARRPGRPRKEATA